MVDTPILTRADISGVLPGPLIVEEYDTTIVVPPGALASLDSFGNIVLNVEAAP